MSLLEKLRDRVAGNGSPADPWLAPLQRVRGKVEFDGKERVSSQRVLDVLEVPQREPHGGDIPACGEVDDGVGLDGCTGPRPYGGAYKEQVRGYVRRARASSARN